MSNRNEHRKLPQFKEISIRAYWCFKCKQSFIPYARSPEKNKRIPRRCHKCKSSKWSVPVEYLEECIRCGAYWDRRIYDKEPSRKAKCPECGREDYRREDWEAQINYSKILKRETKIKKELEKNPVPEYRDIPTVRFKKSITKPKNKDVEEAPSFLDRLREQT